MDESCCSLLPRDPRLALTDTRASNLARDVGGSLRQLLWTTILNNTHTRARTSAMGRSHDKETKGHLRSKSVSNLRLSAC